MTPYEIRWKQYRGPRPRPRAIFAQDNQNLTYKVLYELENYIRIEREGVVYHLWLEIQPNLIEINHTEYLYLGAGDLVLEPLLKLNPDDLYLLGGAPI